MVFTFDDHRLHSLSQKAFVNVCLNQFVCFTVYLINFDFPLCPCKVERECYNLTNDKNVFESGWFYVLPAFSAWQKLLRFDCIRNVIKKFIWYQFSSPTPLLSLHLCGVLSAFDSYAASSLLFLCLFTSICVCFDRYLYDIPEVLSRLFRLKIVRTF